MGDLTKNFSKSEIRCKCGCGLDSIDPILMEMAQAVRDECGFPIIITSGCRCVKHNKSKLVGGKADSAHLPNKQGVCQALDIAFTSGAQLYAIMNAAFNAGFQRIGINFAKNFIHVDVDKSKPRNTIFRY